MSKLITSSIGELEQGRKAISERMGGLYDGPELERARVELFQIKRRLGDLYLDRDMLLRPGVYRRE